MFHRYHEKDITKIRGEETCRSIVGYDADFVRALSSPGKAGFPWSVLKPLQNTLHGKRALD